MTIDWSVIDAVLFDLDGVLTPTAKVHEAAWKRSFDDFLADHVGPGYEPFAESDYLAHVDGKPRYDGVRTFLTARGIVLPEGTPSDPAGHDTVCALGNLKNDMFNRVLAEDGVEPYPDAMALLDALSGLPLGVVSSSANAVPVLDAAGILGRFLFVMDGVVARERNLPGKPAPDTFLVAASEIGADPSRTVVFEDAVSGVAAGVAGGFTVVVGVDRTGSAESLIGAGAHMICTDLKDFCPTRS
ncbi:MAG: HAD family hydrolase [Acidimicrobiia bacterium]